eukprot:15358463-Ditylum_brightwellii.AAC.1
MGNINNAVTNYDKAIVAAGESKHIHEEAIANERAGDFCLSKGDARAYYYYSRAHELYLQWGAKGKAVQLGKKRPSADFSI